MRRSQLRRGMGALSSIVMGAFVLVSAQQATAAAPNLANGKNIFMNGKGDVPACTSCHGMDGMGNDSMGTPRLAGQIGQFIRKQLEDFATDKRQDMTMFVMNTNAKGLTPQDRLDVAAYLSQLNADQIVLPKEKLSNLAELKANGTEIGTKHVGKAIVNYGIPERGVPACRSCHDYNGRGVDPVYPVIGQQKMVYLTNQLKHWKDHSRTNDPLGQMQRVAEKLTDEEILDVATFLSQASPLTIGNSRVPERHSYLTEGH